MFSSLRFSRGKLSAMSRRAKITVASFAALAAMPLGTTSLRAATLYWSDPATGLWQTPALWYTDAAGMTPSTGFPVAGDDVIFNITGANVNTAITSNNTISANSLTFNSTGTTTIQSNGTTARNLFLTGGITVNAGSGAVTLGTSSATIIAQVSNSQTYTNNSASTLNFRNSFNSVGSAGNSELTLSNTSTGGINFSGAISNGTAGGSLALTVNSSGTGNVALNGTSTYTGGTKIINGSVSGALGSFFGTGQGTVSLGDSTPGSTGSAFLSVTGGTTAVALTTVAGTSGTLTLSTGTSAAVFTGAVTLGNNLTVSASSSTVTNSVTISGVISGAGALTATKATGGGSAPVILTNANTYTGGTFVGTGTTLSGVLQINNGGTDATASAIGTGRLTIQGAAGGLIDNTSSGDVTLATNNAQTWNSDFTYVGSVHSLNLGTGAVSLGTSALATRTVTVSANTLTVGGVISDGTNVTTPTRGITKAGAGTLALTNTSNAYTGPTTINGGVLTVANLSDGGAPSVLGASTNLAANLLLNNGTLQYTGTGASTDRLFTVGPNSAATGTIDASGTGTLNFTNTGSIAYGAGSTGRTLVLTGTNTGNNTMAPLIAAGSTTINVSKTNVGTWVLTNSNTFGGATTIGTAALGTAATSSTSNGGTLVANGAGTLGSGTVGTSGITIHGGSTLLITNGVSPSTDHVRNTATMTLGTAGATGFGGTLVLGPGVSEGSAASLVDGSAGGANTTGIGMLTLASSSTIDFNSGGLSTLVFSGLTNTGGFGLNIVGYTNTHYDGLGNSGDSSLDDRLVFATSLTTAQLATINFGPGTAATEMSLGNGYFEVSFMPVPEPSTWAAMLLGVGMVGYGVFRRRSVPARSGGSI